MLASKCSFGLKSPNCGLNGPPFVYSCVCCLLKNYYKNFLILNRCCWLFFLFSFSLSVRSLCVQTLRYTNSQYRLIERLSSLLLSFKNLRMFFSKAFRISRLGARSWHFHKTPRALQRKAQTSGLSNVYTAGIRRVGNCTLMFIFSFFLFAQ